eukprot:155974_1
MLAKVYRQTSRLISISLKRNKFNYACRRKLVLCQIYKPKRSFTTKETITTSPTDDNKNNDNTEMNDGDDDSPSTTDPQRTFVGKPSGGVVEKEMWVESMTPKKIVEQLDRYIIGQDKAKRAVSVSLRNRWRRQQLNDDLKKEVMPMNILMMGPTGTGKTEIARRLAQMVDAPFIKCEATKYTEVGIVGQSAEESVKDLVDKSIKMEKERKIEK